MNGGTICLAGYVATDEGWADFANAWLPLAQKHHFQWLHTSDFLTGNAEYANLGLCQEQRVALLREFISLINNHLDFGVVVAVDTVALIQLTKGSKPRVEKNQWCLSRALRHIFEVSGLFPQSGPISLICDRGQSEGHMLGAYNALRSGLNLACVAIKEHVKNTRQRPTGLPSLNELLAIPEGSRVHYSSEYCDKVWVEKNADFIRQAAGFYG
jgi:hypothetical protein